MSLHIIIVIAIIKLLYFNIIFMIIIIIIIIITNAYLYLCIKYIAAFKAFYATGVYISPT